MAAPPATAETPPAPATARPPATPPPAPAPAKIDPVAAPAVERLAAQLMIAPDSIRVVGIAPTEWPDACLGLPAEGEICAMMITPGYAITLAVAADTYVFRTDLAGTQTRVASAPPARVGDPLVTWRDARSFNTMLIGTQLVAIGRRGRPLIAAPLAVPARAGELQEFLARYGPFQAQTPAGEIALRGVGSARASDTEQRMIAEWARLVSLEARAGGEVNGAEIALTWTRRGGIAGFCDTIEITRTGTATASTCRGGAAVLIARLALPPDELAQLYRWLDRFEAFTAATGDPAAADALLTTLDLRGTGVDEAASGDHQAILAWIDTLALRLRDAALR